MTEKDNPMVNNLARARARKAADSWLADRKLAMPIPPRVSGAWAESALADAFVAGWGDAIAPGTESEVNAIVASFIRTAQVARTEGAADEAALRIFAYLGAIHRDEQDQWAAERKFGGADAGLRVAPDKPSVYTDEEGGLVREFREFAAFVKDNPPMQQREVSVRMIIAIAAAMEEFEDRERLGDARALIAEAAAIFREYEKIAVNDLAGHGVTPASPTVRMGRNRRAAQRLEAWLRGADQYPTHLTDAEPGDAPEPSATYRLGEAHDLVSAMRDAALIEEGDGWVKVHGVRDASALFKVLRLAKIATEVGQPDAENPEAFVDWFEGARLVVPDEGSVVAHGGVAPADRAGLGPDQIAVQLSPPWRQEGVADLGAFRLGTGDPRFDPAKALTVNGFLYEPATTEK